MAVIVTNGNVKLSTASAFYRAEAMNISPFSTTSLALTSTRTLSPTFSNAGTLKGVMICLVPTAATSLKPVTLTLKQVGVTRATVTMTAAQITNSITSASANAWFVAFEGFNFAIDVLPATWTIEITQGAGTNGWSVKTSDATNVFYVAWADNLVSYTTNDTVIAKNVLTIDQAATFNGTLGTGDAANGVAMIIGKGSDGTPGNVANVLIDPTLTSQTTVKWNGVCVVGAHSALRAGAAVLFTVAPAAAATSGTLASNWAYTTGTYNVVFTDVNVSSAPGTTMVKAVTLTNGATTATWSGGLARAATILASTQIPYDNTNKGAVADLFFDTANVGTLAPRITDVDLGGNTTATKMSFFLHGQFPTNEFVNLAADVAASQPVFNVVEDVTSGTNPWVSNDVVHLGGSNVISSGDTTKYVIAGNSGTATMTIASPCVVTFNSHGFIAGAAVRFTTTGALPTGITANTIYYVKSPATNTFNISATSGGSNINTTGSQSGTHTVSSQPYYDGSKTWINLTANIGTARTSNTGLTGGYQLINTVMRFNGYGVRIRSTSTVNSEVHGVTNFVLSGVENNNFLFRCNFTTGAVSGDDSANFIQKRISHCTTRGQGLANGLYPETGTGNVLIEYFYVCTGGAILNPQSNTTTTSQAHTYDHIYYYGIGNASMTLTSFCYVSNVKIENTDSFCPLIFSGSGLTVSNITAWGSGASSNSGGAVGGAIGIGTLFAPITFDTITTNKCTQGVGPTGSTAAIQITNFRAGNAVANTTDFSTASGVYVDIEFVTPQTTIAPSTTNESGWAVGSQLQISNNNNTVDDNRALKRQGFFFSSAATLKQATNQATETLTNTIFGSSQTVAGVKLYTAITCQINSSNYYAATYTAPTLFVDYDNGSTSSVAASNSTSAQTLSVIVTPSTSNNSINVRMTSKSDGNGSLPTPFSAGNSTVTWSSLMINARLYGKVFQTYSPSIIKVTKNILFQATTLAANGYITQATQATAHAYTGIALNSGAKTVTVTSTHTIEEIYDFTQDYLTLDANMGVTEFLTSVDGTTFTFTNGWSLIVSGAGIKVTSATRKFAFSGGGALTLSSGALYEDSTGVQFDVSGTIYYATHFYINCKKASDGTTNIQTAIIAFIDSAGNDRTYNTSLTNGGLVTDSSGNVEGYAVYKIASTTYTGHKLQVGHYSYNWLQTPTTVNGTPIGSSGSYNGQLLVLDSSITLAQATADAVSGVTVNTSTKAVGMNSNTLSQVMHWLKSQQTKAAEIDTTNHIKGYMSAYLVSVYSDTGLILRYDLSNYHGAYGWTYSSSGYGGTLFIKNSSGTITSSATQVIIPTLVAGSTVQIYDSTSSTELYNSVVAGTSLTFQYTWSADHTLRVRARKQDQLFSETSQSVGNTGATITITQTADAIYTANGVDGSTVTECSLSGSTVKIYINDPDNTTTAQRIYNWYKYILSTTTYIGLQPDDIVANTTTRYTFNGGLKIVNQNVSTPLGITGANITDASNDPIAVLDVSNGASIAVNAANPAQIGSDIANTIWTVAVPGSFSAGTAGQIVGSKLLTTSKFLGLK